MSRRSGGFPRDAVFVFDAEGNVCASTPGADEVVGGGRVARIADLEARYRGPDGLALQLGSPGMRVAVDVDGKSGTRVTITTEPLREGLPGSPTVIVAVRPLRGEDEPDTVQRALGSILAHELKTPLTTIVGGSQLVASSTASDGVKRDAATSVLREAQRLNRIVEDLVVLVRSRRDPPPELEPVMLQHVLPRVVDEERELSPDAEIRLVMAERLPPVLAAEVSITHAMRNLLDHAVRYSPRGGVVEVTARRTNGSVDIRVADAGPGRDASAAARAFDLFTSSGRTSLDASGANLRLVVARQLIERMGGRTRASSAEGGEITISMPVARDAAELRAPAKARRAL